MNIPYLTKDLAVIQKLSDLPNITDGLSAAALKAKFDEAALAIQNWINNDLIPALKAENLPFEGSDQLDVEDVQAAIELVFEQVRDASSGTITNGSVTKAKLAAELLARTFGGRPWVSLEKPTEANNPDSEFPIGQIWLRPGFSVSNAAVGGAWGPDKNAGTTVSVSGNNATVTCGEESVFAKASFLTSHVGQSGDRVYVLFNIKNKDEHIKTLTVTIGGIEETVDTYSNYETVLSDGGSLSLLFAAEWEETPYATGSFTVENLTVINIDQIMRQAYGAREFTDWISYLRALMPLPLDGHDTARAMYIQTSDGVWTQFDYETFPVERGGTGVSELKPGEMLFGIGESRMEILPVPETAFSLLQFADGLPKWATPKETADSCGFARTAESTYEGTGKAGAVELPGKPAVLWLRFDEETHLFFQNTSMTGEYSGKCNQTNDVTGTMELTKQYKAGVSLEGNALRFWIETPELKENEEWVEGDAVHFNEKNKQYTWTAIY